MKIVSIFLSMVLSCIYINNAWALENLKKTVAVFEFHNDSGYHSEPLLAKDFTTQLSDALIQSGKFIVLTRSDLDVVFAEQDLASTNRMVKANAAKTGRAIPAQVLIKGRMTEFEANTAGGGTGLSIAGFTIGSKKSTAHVAVIVQLIDSTTGEIITSKRVEGEARSGGLSLGYSGKFDLNSSNFKKTPLGKAIQMSIDRAVVYISEEMDRIPWKGKVVIYKEGVVFINAGSNAGINNGDIFQIVREGESLIDPDTGINLGSEKFTLVSVKIFDVKEKFSKAEILGNSDIEIMKGDLVLK